MDVSPDLVRAAQQGDQAALEDLIARSYRAAYTLALRLMGNPDDAAEATQESFIRMVRGLRRFREVGAYPTWLFKITSNVCMTEIRKRNRRAMPIEIDQQDAPEELRSLAERSPIDVESTAIGNVFWEELEAKVMALPETYRTVVVLRDVYGLSGEDTGQILGITPGAVKVRLHRARRKLRDEIEAQFPEWAAAATGGSDDGTDGRGTP